MIENEKAVLGSILMDNKMIERIPFLDKKHFINSGFANMFEKMKEMYAKKESIDIVTIKQYTKFTSFNQDKNA